MKVRSEIATLFEKIRKLRAGEVDNLGNLTLEEAVAASRGNLSPLLFYYLKKYGLTESLDERIRRGLNRDYVMAQANYLSTDQELAKLIDLFEKLEIRVMLFKGGFTRRFYPDPSLRVSGDYDFIVATDDEVFVLDRMIEAGFQLVTTQSRYFLDRLGGGRTLKRGDFRKFIDLHFRPFQKFRYTIDIEEMWNRCSERGDHFCYPSLEDQIVLTMINIVKDGFTYPLTPWIDLLLLLERGVDMDYIEYQIRRSGLLRGFVTITEVLKNHLGCSVESRIRAKPLDVTIVREDKLTGLKRYLYAMSTINKLPSKILFASSYLFLAGVDWLYGK